MTITTAKKQKAAGLRLTPLALAALLLSTAAQAGDWRISPSIALRETYSDNLNNQPDQSAKGGFVSEIAPGVSVVGRSRRLQVSANAEVRRYFYHNDDIQNVRDSERRYSALAKSELVDEFLFLDASASGSRQTVSPFGPLATNSYSAYNNTDVRTWSISPYVTHRFGRLAVATVRVGRDSVTSGLRTTYGDTMSTSRSASVASGPHFTDFGWALTYNHQDITSSTSGSFMTENSLLSLRQRINRKLALTSSVGYDKYEYPALDQRTNGPGWSAGFIWTPSTRTSVDMSFGHRYFGKTGSLDASHRTRHSTWSLTYTDGVTTTRSQFLLPAAVDTAAMLDRMFLASYPDPVLRQQAVLDYMAATGLPPSLANNINYLTNRFVRNKRLQGAVVVRGARTDLAFSLFKDERRALSLQEMDSPLLGAQQGTLYDNTRQKGASASGNYRLSSRTSTHARLYFVRVESLETNLVNNVNQASIGMTHLLNARSSASIDLRHSTGRVDMFNNNKYHENAVVATLSYRY